MVPVYVIELFAYRTEVPKEPKSNVQLDMPSRFKEDKKDTEVLAFHGTPKENVKCILAENLQLKYAKRQLYGPGNIIEIVVITKRKNALPAQLPAWLH